MTKKFEFWLRPKRKERLDKRERQSRLSRGVAEENAGWVCWAVADRMLVRGVEACVGSRNREAGASRKPLRKR